MHVCVSACTWPDITCSMHTLLITIPTLSFQMTEGEPLTHSQAEVRVRMVEVVQTVTVPPKPQLEKGRLRLNFVLSVPPPKQLLLLFISPNYLAWIPADWDPCSFPPFYLSPFPCPDSTNWHLSCTPPNPQAPLPDLITACATLSSENLEGMVCVTGRGPAAASQGWRISSELTVSHSVGTSQLWWE